jgi:hypothetical protein
MKLEKFDLEKVIHGAKVVTRDGREVSQLTKFDTYEKFCLYGVVNDEIQCWDIKGRCYEGANPNIDLFLVGKVQSIWVNIYRKDGDEGIFIGNRRYTSQEDAIEYIHQNDTDYIKTIEITDEV